MAKSKQEFDLVPLITKVKENPILYDTNHEDYGDPKKTNRAWNGIARELLLPNGEVVRCKWKSTCEIYLKSLKGNKKNAAIKWPWAEHMKFFEPYLKNGKTSDEQTKDDTATSTPSKKSATTKRQRSPLEVATSRRFSRSVAAVEEELGETDSQMKKARISILEETVENKVTSTKGTPRKSEMVKTSSYRQPRSTIRALESQVSIDEEESDSSTSPQKIATKPSNKNINLSPSKTLPIGISPEMKKGPRRLPRSVLRALEAEASNTIENSQQAHSLPSANQISEESSVSAGLQSTKRSRRLSFDPNLTSSVRSPLRSARYSAIPEQLSPNKDLLGNSVSSARFSTNQTILTGAKPESFRESVDYFESASREPRRKDIEMISEKRSSFSSPSRHTVSSLASTSLRLPRSSALEEEFARHDALMENSVILETSEDGSSFSEKNNSRYTSVVPGTKEKMDATDLLFLSHALTIKSFSERKQVEVKRRIAQIIAQAEIEEVA